MVRYVSKALVVNENRALKIVRAYNYNSEHIVKAHIDTTLTPASMQKVLKQLHAERRREIRSVLSEEEFKTINGFMLTHGVLSRQKEMHTASACTRKTTNQASYEKNRYNLNIVFLLQLACMNSYAQSSSLSTGYNFVATYTPGFQVSLTLPIFPIKK